MPLWLQDGWGYLGLAASLYALVYIAWTYFHWGAQPGALLIPNWDEAMNLALISDIAYLPMSLFAASAAWRIAYDPAHTPQLRWAWLFLGLGIFGQFIGDVVWAYLELYLQLPTDEITVSAADFFYLAFYPLVLLGLLALVREQLRPTERVRVGLDLFIVLIAAWMVVWYFIVSVAAANSDKPLIERIAVALYPVGDLVVLSGLITLLLRRAATYSYSALLLFILGAFIFIGTDLAYAYTAPLDLYVTGGWLDAGWLISYLCFGLAALRQAHSSLRTDLEWWQRRLKRLAFLLPFAAIGLAYGLVLAVLLTGFGLESLTQLQGLFLGAALLTLLVLGRQMITLRENQQLNAELRAFSSQLEEKVVERTAQLQETQQALLDSQKLASVGTLAAGIVHEVSNPLNTIITAAESLEMQINEGQVKPEQLPETLEVYLPIISRAAWHAAKILQALRSYSRGSVPELTQQSLTVVIQEALLLMGYQLKKWNKVKLVTELAPDLPEVICDRNQIAQVLINLLNNARDAMPNGGEVLLRTCATPEGAVIEVVDQGLGIAPEALAKIFDPFYTTKGIGKGSGLGLSIVSSIIAAHHGTLRVTSEGLGHGATFRVTLPFAVQEANPPIL